MEKQQRRNEMVAVRFTVLERRLIERAVELAGLTVSEFIRRFIIGEARQRVADAAVANAA